MDIATPVRLRASEGEAIGTTAFFRNRPLFDTLLELMKASGEKHFSILFHACSIGAEVYSFVAQYLLQGHDRQFTIACHATDKQPNFLEFARHGAYPATILSGMTGAEQQYFDKRGDEVHVADTVKTHIQFLPPSDFSQFTTDTPYDIVFLLNGLVYVPADTQRTTLEKIARYNRKWLLTTAFHQGSIKRDLQRNGYSPVPTNIEVIHNHWRDRIRPQRITQLPDNIYTDWSLPVFSKITDYEYRYCAIFSKSRASALS